MDLPERNKSIELCLPAMLAKDCTALYMYPCFASATGYKQEISTMEGGTVGQDCFHIILHGLNRAGHAVGDHGTPPQSEELTLLLGGGTLSLSKELSKQFYSSRETSRNFEKYLLSRAACSTWGGGRVAEPQPGTGQCMGPAQDVGGGDEAGSIPGSHQ